MAEDAGPGRGGQVRKRLARLWSFICVSGFCIAGAFALLVGVGYLFSLVYTSLNELRTAHYDNSQWTLSQLEADLLRFGTAILVAEHYPDSNIDDVRLRFDNFYSRFTMIERSTAYAGVRTADNASGNFDAVRDFLDRTAQIVDGEDEYLVASLPSLEAEVLELTQTVREIALAGVGYYARASDQQRSAFVDLQLLTTRVVLALFVVLTLLLVFLRRQLRVSQDRAWALSLSGERLAATFNASLDAIVLVDSRGRIIEYNEAATGIFGHTRSAAIGANMAAMMVPPNYRAAHDAGMARFLRTGEKRVVDKGRLELSAMRADGVEIPVEISIGSATDVTGPIFIAYLRDISAQKAAETALRDARDRALSADRAKSEFIAIMSHEMRTPLNGVLGVLDLLAETKLDATQRKFVDVALGSGEILRRHVDDVLDISRIESGGFKLNTKPVHLLEVLDEVVGLLQPLALQKHNRIEIRADLDDDAFVIDENRVRQILLNLAGNAAKFTENGVITVGAQVIDRTGDRAEIEISVSDTGIGIAPEDQDRIFHDFVTLDAGYRRNTSGSGLGLGIIRRLVNAMGGTLGVASAVGKGSRFWVRLVCEPADAVPRAEPHAGRPQRTQRTTAAPVDVLVVEDNEVNRFVLRNMLEAHGHHVTEAVDGLEGVAAAESRAFDIILMDISMPKLDGIEAARRIREGNGPSRLTPIVALTAHAMKSDIARFKTAGMNDYMVKPLRSADLDRLLSPSEAPERTEPEDYGEDAAGVEEIDEEVLEELAASMSEDMLRNLLSKAADELHDGLRILRSSAGVDQPERAACAHKMAGLAGTLGLIQVSRTCAAMEAGIKASGEIDPQELDMLEAGMETGLHVLAEYLLGEALPARTKPSERSLDDLV